MISNANSHAPDGSGPSGWQIPVRSLLAPPRGPAIHSRPLLAAFAQRHRAHGAKTGPYVSRFVGARASPAAGASDHPPGRLASSWASSGNGCRTGKLRALPAQRRIAHLCQDQVIHAFIAGAARAVATAGRAQRSNPGGPQHRAAPRPDAGNGQRSAPDRGHCRRRLSQAVARARSRSSK